MKKFLLLILLLNSCFTLFSQNFQQVDITQGIESPLQLEPVDLNNDTLVDFLVLGYTDFYFFENAGNGQFNKSKLVDTLSRFTNFCIYDWNSDGWMDILLTLGNSYYGSRVVLLTSDSSLNFTYTLINDSVYSPMYVKAIDFDLDGDNDILVSDSQLDELYFMQNDGLGNFTIDTIGYGINQFEVADYNGDNDLDIIYAKPYNGISSTTVRCLQNNGSGSYSIVNIQTGFKIIHEIIVDDINNDGAWDILVPDYSDDKLVWLKNSGSYSFTEINIKSSFDGVHRIAIGDMNQDGKKDVLAASKNSDEIYMFIGTGSVSNYSFTSGTLLFNGLNSVSDLAVADFDEQNHVDFIHIDQYDRSLSLWWNNGSEQFTEEKLAFSFDSPRAFDMGDLDGDGDQDFAGVSNDGDRVGWFENVGNDDFKTHILIENYEEPYVVKIDDLDQDGDMDIIAASDFDDRVTWWENDGSGSFTLAHISTNINAPRDLWIDDFDQDGDKDVAVVGYWLYSQSGNSGVWWFKNDGNENFTIHEIDEDIRAGRSVRGADMNGDSIVDLVISSYYYTNSTLRIATGTGTGFGIVNIDDVQCEDFELVDFDADNDLDILAIDFAEDSLYFYENTGNLQFTRHTLAWIYRLYAIEPVDFDGDSDIDVLFSTGYSGFTNSSDFISGIFRNDGQGNLVQETWYTGQSMIKPMEVFDYESDGDFDYVVGYDYGDRILMYKNLEVDCFLDANIAPGGLSSMCPGDSVQLMVQTTANLQSIQWSLDGSILTGDTLNQIWVTNAGIYSALVSDSSCTKQTNTIPVNFAETWDVYDTLSLCQGDSVLFNGQYLSATGDYDFMGQTAFGCDSIRHLHLEINPVFESFQATSICDGDSLWFNNQYISSAGSYTENLVSMSGCDSILHLELTINPVFQTDLIAEICEGESYIFGNDTLTSEGNFTQVLSSQYYCDSVVNLALTVHPVQESYLNETICDGSVYDFFGTNLSQAGSYQHILSSQYACDSTIHLDLSILPVDTIEVYETFCEGESLTIEGQLISQSGIYTYQLTNASGCDSLRIYTVDVLPVDTTLIQVDLCANESFVYQSDTLSMAGDYWYQYQNQFACDSLVLLQIDVLQLDTVAVYGSICEGEQYVYNGDSITQAGLYQYHFTNMMQCDSLVNLTIDVLPAYEQNLMAQICFGDEYIFGGDTISQPGVYTDSLQSFNLCDSIITLDLEVILPDTTSIEAWICEGEEYLFGGQVLSEEGIYYQSLVNEQGCDSIIELGFSVVENPTVDLGNDTSISNESVILLSAGQGFYSYTWQDASNDSVFLVDGAVYSLGDNLFWVSVQNDSLCSASDSIIVNIYNVIGIGEEINSGLNIYPNPGSNYVVIKSLSGKTPILNCKIYDIRGRIIFEENYAQQSVKVQVESLATGMYFIEVRTIKQVYRLPWIKE